MSRSPLGDLVAAAVLATCFLLLVYLAVREGRLGMIERSRSPLLFWLCVGGAGLVGVTVAVLIAGAAIPAL